MEVSILESIKNCKKEEKISYEIIDLGCDVSIQINVAYNDLAKTVKAIENIYKQHKFVQNNTEKINTLTTREMDVLKLIVNGFCSKEIAVKLYIELSTVSTHRKNIIRKIGIQHSMDWFLYGQAFNLIN